MRKIIQVAKANFQTETSLGWYRFSLNLFYSLRHYINTISRWIEITLEHFQNPRWRARWPAAPRFHNEGPLSAPLWQILMTLVSFDMFFQGPRFNGETCGNIKSINHGHISIMLHLGVARQCKSSWKWLKITFTSVDIIKATQIYAHLPSISINVPLRKTLQLKIFRCIFHLPNVIEINDIAFDLWIVVAVRFLCHVLWVHRAFEILQISIYVAVS